MHCFCCRAKCFVINIFGAGKNRVAFEGYILGARGVLFARGVLLFFFLKRLNHRINRISDDLLRLSITCGL